MSENINHIIEPPIAQVRKTLDVNLCINLRSQVSWVPKIQLNQYPYCTSYKLHNQIIQSKHLILK